MRTGLPPQAYTRETLSQAFTWLQSQPSSVKALAQNPDTLVTLYLRQKRGTPMATLESEAPVSTESFRTNLKSLAAELQQFESPLTIKPETELKTPVLPEPPKPETRVSTQAPSLSSLLDGRSLETLGSVRSRFNLSSDMEALRMLIVLGSEKLQGLL